MYKHRIVRSLCWRIDRYTGTVCAYIVNDANYWVTDG